MRYERVLLATDLSDNAKQAARLGVRLAGEGAQLRLVHVIQNPEPPVYFRDRLRGRYDELSQTTRDKVASAVGRWADGAQLPAHDVVVREGAPAREIEREAARFGADLIVVGARGRGRITEALLGSTAKAMVRRAACDLLVVHARHEAPPRLRRVAVATDFYEPAKVAARRAADIAAAQGAELSALHVIDRDLWAVAAYEDVPVIRGEVDWAWIQHAVGEMLHEFNVETMGGKAHEALRDGRPGPESAAYVAGEHIDLLVVGTHGAGGIERALLGSVAESIVEEVRAPVLVVRAPAR